MASQTPRLSYPRGGILLLSLKEGSSVLLTYAPPTHDPPPSDGLPIAHCVLMSYHAVRRSFVRASVPPFEGECVWLRWARYSLHAHYRIHVAHPYTRTTPQAGCVKLGRSSSRSRPDDVMKPEGIETWRLHLAGWLEGATMGRTRPRVKHTPAHTHDHTLVS